jgi:hypothetical protein
LLVQAPSRWSLGCCCKLVKCLELRKWCIWGRGRINLLGLWCRLCGCGLLGLWWYRLGIWRRFGCITSKRKAPKMVKLDSYLVLNRNNSNLEEYAS